ncbi:MAG: heavy-metal-associated domain-containing protein [Pirellulales bacterium]
MSSRLFWLSILALSFAHYGCSDATNLPTAISAESTTPVAFNSAGAPTVEFSVPDMMCPEGCGEKTKEILAGQPGAKDVYVNFEAKTATVAIEDGKFDAEQALAALVDHGFDHTTLKGDAATAEADAASAVQ